MTMNEEAKKITALTDWPKTEEEATADALIIHGARVSMAMAAASYARFNAWSSAARGTAEHTATLKAYLDAASAMIAQSQVVIALVETQQRSPSEADALAHRLYNLTEDGGVLQELMWDYLSARGVDAKAVWAAAQADFAEGDRS